MRQLAIQSTTSPGQYSGRIGIARLQSFSFLTLVFLVAHIPLALLMRQAGIVATLHAIITFLIGVFFAITEKRPQRVIYVVAYIAGAELLWRGNEATIFYEFGKYAASIILILSMLKQRDVSRRDILPLFYFLLLVPSSIQAINLSRHYTSLENLTFLEYPFFYLGLDREALAFNLSGPFALAISAIYFSNIRLDRDDIRHLGIACIGPIVGLLSLAIFTTVSSASLLGNIRASSHFTAGDIGPNQVSSMLGFGAFISFLLLFLLTNSKFLRIVVVLLGLTFGAQAILTLSRGGVWSALGAILVASVYLLRDSRSRMLLIAGGTVIFLTVTFLLIPLLDSLTNGGVMKRFDDTDPTGRDEIVNIELQLFEEYPIFGIGPGQTFIYTRHSPHTEYTRLIAEHGILGITAIVILGLICIRRALSKVSPLSKSFVLSLSAWTLLFMTHAAMRLFAPSFTFGLAAATFAFDDTKSNENRFSFSDIPSERSDVSL